MLLLLLLLMLLKPPVAVRAADCSSSCCLYSRWLWLMPLEKQHVTSITPCLHPAAAVAEKQASVLQVLPPSPLLLMLLMLLLS
jgi:hypothetical protein